MLYVLLLLAAVNSRRFRSADGSSIGLAREAIDRLSNVLSTEASTKNTLKFSLLSTEDQDKVTKTRKELTHSRLISEYKTFLAEVLKLGTGRIVIGIDELDKIAEGGDALAIVNSLKELFHEPGVHFVVSVSEDALHNFALRGIPLRDAFDSSFDFIVPVKRFKAIDSVNLLNRRVVGLPYLLALFCHSVSGGLPRDLIRTARQCIDVRRRVDGPVQAASVVVDICSRLALSVLDAAVARASDLKRPELHAAVRARTLIEHRDDAQLSTALESAGTMLLRERRKEELVFERVAVFLLCLATALGYFEQMASDVSQWRTAIDDGNAVRQAELFSRAFSSIAVSAEEALSIARPEGLAVAPTPFQPTPARLRTLSRLTARPV